MLGKTIAMIRASGQYQDYVRKERKAGRLNDKYFQAMNYEVQRGGKDYV